MIEKDKIMEFCSNNENCQLENIEKVFENNQEHIFRYWNELSNEEKNNLISQTATIDFKKLKNLVEKAKNPKQEIDKTKITPVKTIKPLKTDDEKEKRKKAEEKGINAIKNNKVGAFVVAGGQGSRLGFDGPKGKLPITNIKNKTLFQLFAEKIKATEKKYNAIIPLLIMTSETNDKETREYFEENNYFDLGKENIMIFKQGLIPTVDNQGNLMLKNKSNLVMNPDGHGGSIKALYDSGAIIKMKEIGVKYISYFQVDNPLIKIIDPIFIGYHIMEQSEMSAKVIPKSDPEEKVGAYIYLDGKMTVIEYSDLTKEDMYKKDEQGNLIYGSGNPAMHMIDVEFIEKENKGGIHLPYHIARKKANTIDGEKECMKFEMFVFDAITDAQNPVLFEVNRKNEFSPTKNKEGKDSLETSKDMQNELFASWLEASGIDIPRKDEKIQGDIEISPLFALDKEEFISKYNEKPNLEKDFKLYIE